MDNIPLLFRDSTQFIDKALNSFTVKYYCNTSESCRVFKINFLCFSTHWCVALVILSLLCVWFIWHISGKTKSVTLTCDFTVNRKKNKNCSYKPRQLPLKCLCQGGRWRFVGSDEVCETDQQTFKTLWIVIKFLNLKQTSDMAMIPPVVRNHHLHQP